MDKTTYKKFAVGDQVTVKQPNTAYDRAPDITPGMIGIIKAFPPKIRKVKGPLFDRGDYFAYVEFKETYTIKQEWSNAADPVIQAVIPWNSYKRRLYERTCESQDHK